MVYVAFLENALSFPGTKAHQGTSYTAVQWPEGGMMGHLTSSQGSDLN